MNDRVKCTACRSWLSSMREYVWKHREGTDPFYSELPGSTTVHRGSRHLVAVRRSCSALS